MHKCKKVWDHPARVCLNASAAIETFAIDYNRGRIGTSHTTFQIIKAIFLLW